MWPFKQKPKPEWYDTRGYLKIPEDKLLALTWTVDDRTSAIVSIDTVNNKIIVYRNTGLYLNTELAIINV